MRCYQEIGLTGDAEEFLRENIVLEDGLKCPHCSGVLSQNPKILSTEDVDMFHGDGPTLNTYELKDGMVCKEVVQCSPWSSGPMAFLCLEIDGKKMFEWTDEEINQVGY